MFEIRKKKDIWQYFSHPISIIVGLVLLFVVSKATLNVYEKERESSKELAQVEAVFEETKEREEFLSSEIDSLETDRGKEEKIRDKFRVAKDGEKMVIIVDSDEDKQGQLSGELKEKNLWQKILGLFGL